MSFYDFLENLKKKPKEVKVAIVWAIIIPIGIIFFIIWINIAKESFTSVSQRGFLPEIPKELKEKEETQELISFFSGFSKEEIKKRIEELEEDEEFRKLMEEDEEFRKLIEEIKSK